jgi:ubiquinone/menaquinone biosynthesis C-methylase UbiE
VEYEENLAMSRLETGFRDVDAAGDAEAYADYLSHVNSLESVADGKRARARLLGLHQGARAIDVGCGLGDDARALSRLIGPQGEVIGLDSSTALLERAQAHCQAEDGPITFVAGDAHDLPFDTGAFDAARTERTLQHLENPARAIGELARVTRPNGVVLVHEPDWGTLASTGRPRELVRPMLAAAEAQIRNPWIGRELAGLFVDAGLTDVTVLAEVLLVRDFYPDVIIDLPLLAADLRAQGHQGVDDLLAAAEADSHTGRTVAALTLFTVYARVPPRHR